MRAHAEKITPFPKPAAPRAASKTTVAYWMRKVALEEKPGWQSANYFVRIQAKGQRRKVKLDASLKEDAAREASAIYMKVMAHGWDAMATKTQGIRSAPVAPAGTTVGTWIEFSLKRTDVSNLTVSKYTESLKTIVGEILSLTRTRGAEAKRIIQEANIDILSKANVQGWVNRRLEAARALNPVQARRAQNTIRTLIGNAKALFTDAVLEAGVHPKLPGDDIPFRRLKLPPKVVGRYSSRFNPGLLLQAAREDLDHFPQAGDSESAASRYEQWKILYLALVAGLRYNEIDKLRTTDISPAEGRIAIRPNESFTPKTLASEGEVLVDEQAREVLKTMLKSCQSGWLLREAKSKRVPKYRAGANHDGLIAWLRAYEENGHCPFADVHKPIHELRKEAGTLVNSLHGLAEAKTFLRHSSISTTATFYVGSKGKIHTGLH